MGGFEPSTPALRKRCSTVELHRHKSLDFSPFLPSLRSRPTVLYTCSDTRLRRSPHAYTSSYRARQAKQALPGLPPVPARHRPMGQEDQGQDALLRAVGRPRRRPGEVPGTEGRAARRAEAAAQPGDPDRQVVVRICPPCGSRFEDQSPWDGPEWMPANLDEPLLPEVKDRLYFLFCRAFALGAGRRRRYELPGRSAKYGAGRSSSLNTAARTRKIASAPFPRFADAQAAAVEAYYASVCHAYSRIPLCEPKLPPG